MQKFLLCKLKLFSILLCIVVLFLCFYLMIFEWMNNYLLDVFLFAWRLCIKHGDSYAVWRSLLKLGGSEAAWPIILSGLVDICSAICHFPDFVFLIVLILYWFTSFFLFKNMSAKGSKRCNEDLSDDQFDVFKIEKLPRFLNEPQTDCCFDTESFQSLYFQIHHETRNDDICYMFKFGLFLLTKHET